MSDAGNITDSKAAGGYRVLARKYRPADFTSLIGQEPMVRTLTNAFSTGRIAQAWMLTGVRGVGKTTTARILARALNYRTDTHDRPSLDLSVPGEHCKAIMEGRHVDVVEMDAASHTGIDDIREIIEQVRYAPVSARYKVYIIDEVHMLSTASFNALLKTLEEPPPHVKFIFATTEIRKVPVTVLSRCQRFNLQRFSTDALTEHLANICRQEGAKVAPDALALIARAAEGSARDGLSILDQAIVQGANESGKGGEVTAEQLRDMLGLADRSRILDLLDTIVAGDHKAALKEAQALLDQGADAPVLIKDLMDVVVEISRAQALKDAYAFAGPADWVKRTLAMADKLSPAQSSRMWRLLLQGFEDCARAPDPPAAAQMVVLRLAAAASLPPPEDVAKLLAGGAAVSPPKSRPEPARASGDAPVASAHATTPAASVGDVPVSPPHEDDHHGPRLSSLRQILAELEAQRQIDLRYDIDRYVRPAEIDFGHFRYTAAPKTPADLSLRIKTWLEETTGVEWEVLQSNDGAAETISETRKRKHTEKLKAAEAYPRIAEALRVFPGAQVLRVEEPQAHEELDQAPAGANVIHVDFSPRESADPDFDPDTSDGDTEDEA